MSYLTGIFSGLLRGADRTLRSFFQSREAAAYLWKKRYFIGYLFAVAVLSQAYELFNFSLTIDEELHASLTAAHKGWTTQGRWGMYLLSALLFPNPVLPVAPALAAVLFSALAFFFVVRIISSQNVWAEYLAAPLFLACPVYYYSFFFSTLSYGIGIGLFLSSASVYFFVSRKGLRRLWSLPTMVFSISIYQAFAVYLAVLFSLYVLSKIIRENEESAAHYFREGALFFAFLCLAFLLCCGINEIFLRILDRRMSSYVDAYINLSWSKRYFAGVFEALKSALHHYYSGNRAAYGGPLSALPFVFLPSLALTLFLTLRNAGGAALRVFGFVLLCGILVMPFALIILYAGPVPPRTCIAVPLVLSGLVLLASAVRASTLRFLLMVCAVYCSFQFVVLNNRLAFSNDLAWQADRELALRIQTEIEDLPGSLPQQEGRKRRAIEIVGMYRWPESALMIREWGIGASFFFWDGGSPSRVISFIRTTGYGGYRAAKPAERRIVMNAAAHMPSWPEEGSIREAAGIIIVKLSDYTIPQLRFLCEGNPRTAPVCENLLKFEKR